jgi:hypothetical protein
MIPMLATYSAQSKRVYRSLLKRHLATLPLTEAQRENSIQRLCSSPMGWTYCKGRDALSKRFQFRDFNEAFGFVSRVAMLAEKVRFTIVRNV